MSTSLVDQIEQYLDRYQMNWNQFIRHADIPPATLHQLKAKPGTKIKALTYNRIFKAIHTPPPRPRSQAFAHVAVRIYAAIIQEGISQRQMAHMLNVQPTGLNRMLNTPPNRPPQQRTLDKLSQRLDELEYPQAQAIPDYLKNHPDIQPWLPYLGDPSDGETR